MNQKGVALVQVLIMSVLLTILATGLLKMTFGTHMLASKVRHTDVRRTWTEACLARKMAEWAQTGGACAVGTCNFGGGNPTVAVTCTAGKANFTVNN